jgi:hypothetical protein
MALPIKNTGLEIDDVHLHKFIASQKIKKVIDFVDDQNSKPLTKTASANRDGLISLFTRMLQQLNLNQSEAADVMNNFASKGPQEVKTAKSIKNSERQSDIKIVSKSIKDSHYQIDVSKDLIKHKGRKVFMVSCYARDSYLGRYLIKRNYFYGTDREASADSAFDEINTKMNALKERYYEEVLDVSGIFAQAKQILDGVVSEIDSSEDDLGTTVSR